MLWANLERIGGLGSGTMMISQVKLRPATARKGVKVLGVQLQRLRETKNCMSLTEKGLSILGVGGGETHQNATHRNATHLNSKLQNETPQHARQQNVTIHQYATHENTTQTQKACIF